MQHQITGGDSYARISNIHAPYHAPKDQAIGDQGAQRGWVHTAGAVRISCAMRRGSHFPPAASPTQ